MDHQIGESRVIGKQTKSAHPKRVVTTISPGLAPQSYNQMKPPKAHGLNVLDGGAQNGVGVAGVSAVRARFTTLLRLLLTILPLAFVPDITPMQASSMVLPVTMLWLPLFASKPLPGQV